MVGRRPRKTRRLTQLLVILCAGMLAGAASAATPQINYMLECQGCHLADGTGSAGSVPALKRFVARFLTVPGGREYLVRVPGSAQSALSDRELAEVLNWIVRQFGPDDIARDFVAFSAEEVARHRSRPLTDVERVRRELIRRMGPAPGSQKR